MSGVEDGRDGEMKRRLTARGTYGADAPFEARDSFLQHRRSRIGDPRIDMTCPLEVEQRGGVIDVLKHIRCRLIHGNRA